MRDLEQHAQVSFMYILYYCSVIPSSIAVGPSSDPRNLILTPSQNSITVRWTRPADEGGRTDLYYQVEHSDPDNLGSYIGAVYLGRGSMTRTRTLTGLRPDTQYCVRVIAHNGVSDQDPEGTHLRTVEECVRTNEARKYIFSSIFFSYSAHINAVHT